MWRGAARSTFVAWQPRGLGKEEVVMRIGYHRRRLADFAGGMRLSRELVGRERWPKERLRQHQQERLDALVRHAVRLLAVLSGAAFGCGR